MSKTIDTRAAVTQAIRNRELKTAAADARGAMRTDAKLRTGGSSAMANLKGAIKTADKLKLGRIAAPLAIGKVAVLATEAVLARLYFEPKAASDTERDVWKGLGNAATFAAGGLLAERLIARSTPSAIPNGRDVATIEKARALIMAPPPPTPVAARSTKAQRAVVKSPIVAEVLKSASKMQAAIAAPAARNVSGILKAAVKSGGKVGALALLASGAIAIGPRWAGSGPAIAAPITTWTDKNGKQYHRTPAGLEALRDRGNR